MLADVIFRKGALLPWIVIRYPHFSVATLQLKF